MSVLFRVGIMALLVTAAFLPAGPAMSEETVHMGFSRSVIGEINENDTMAALKIWSTQLMVGHDFPIGFQYVIYNGLGEIETAIKQRKVDLINLSSIDFFHLQHFLDHERFAFAVYGGSITVEYLLLVREKSGVADIKDLKQGVLRLPKGARSALARVWMDVQLAKAGLPAAKQFFGQMVTVNKISGAVLPVFFGKTDACLVTRNGFDTMAELNPQIAHQLRILAASKGYIPGFLGFRKNYQSKIKGIILNNMINWHNTPAGNQILTMFQMDDIVLKSIETLGPTMALIKEHRALFGVGAQRSRSQSKAKDERF
ncbi:MAG: phosphate/phosphite/phosphonate ABC transporter substrate-binding protein [Desulfobacterales bacterium]|nr:phosphate/phosphite/phosphonate ABC transporter substrate-binding protein [Desulfobacterales bacterium]